MVTMKDIAKAAGVSSATVSRAMKGSGYIGKDMKTKILSIADSLGYVVDANAQSMRTGTTNTIGVIVCDIRNSFFSMVLMEMIQELKESGYTVVLGYSNEDGATELSNLKMMLASRVAGIIFTPVSNENESYIHSLHGNGIPILQLYRRAYEELNSIVVDDERGAYLATSHLIQNGHTDILMLGVDSDISPNRTNGYMTAMNEAHIPIKKNLMLKFQPNEDIKIEVRNVIERCRPTAIVAGTNTFGLDVFAVCHQLGLHVPNDISLVVFDDVPWVQSFDITAIAQPVGGITVTAIHTLINWIKRAGMENAEVVSMKIEPKLISRCSVKNIRKIT